MDNYQITFLNHSSFIMDINDFSVLVDPWYSGKVFNNSWSLIKDTDDSKIDYSKLKYISISHEHPDHFHIGTLKYIRAQTKNKITILFPKRENPNVLEFCKKIGYDFKYINYFTETKIEDNFEITAFPKHTPNDIDSALVYKVYDKIIVNQNDAYLTDDILEKLKIKFPDIDLWLCQFSLAGYYANRENLSELYEKGTKYHMDSFFKYQNYLCPKMSIPFASFVYFCKHYNNYINKYSVKLNELLKESKHIIQIPYYNERISFTSVDKNDLHLSNWVKNKKAIKIDPAPKFPGEEQILSELNKLYSDGYRVKKPVILQFFDYDKSLVINTSKWGKHNRFLFIDNKACNYPITGKLPGEELMSYLKTPWGGDTLNITGCFDKVDSVAWGHFLAAREKLYKR